MAKPMSHALFDSFNARSLHFDQVGSSFVFSPTFRDIASRSHTAIVGPRGSGKTTLLKMLTLPALRAWKGPESSQFKKNLEFTAIYVPADFSWYPDFRRPIGSSTSSLFDETVTTALYRQHVLHSVCQTIEQLGSDELLDQKHLKRFHLEIDSKKGDELASDLAGLWGVKPRYRGVYGLTREINFRIREIQAKISENADSNISIKELHEQLPFISGSFFDDLRGFADSITYHFKTSTNWALCFDELEIAPVPVKKAIFQSLRSFDSRFVLKISASPFDEALDETPIGPMAGHDVNYINLFESTSLEVQRFSSKLFTELCKSLGLGSPQANDVLGNRGYLDHIASLTSSEFEIGNDGDRWAPDSYYVKAFRELARKDNSFGKYLIDKDLDLDKLGALTEVERAAKVRKISALVLIRLAFLTRDGFKSRQPIASIKQVPSIYTGSTQIFTMCEGNPRWLIGLLRPLLEGTKNPPKVVAYLQSERIRKSIATFIALLSTLPSEQASRPIGSVLDLVETVGRYFRAQMLSENFASEPVLSFRIDDQLSPKILTLVARAVNQGAFVFIRDKEVARPLGSNIGRRVRLSHLLAPHYALPLIVGRSIPLSKLLSGEDTMDSEKSVGEQLVLTLLKDDRE
jgi:energy-coupling factor transporter ATP-binding protein EcfA2